MDKVTTGFIKISRYQSNRDIKKDLISRYKEVCLKDYGINANVTVKFTPIEEIVKNPDDRLDFTHAYSIRCRG